jgi:hypothetical protein
MSAPRELNHPDDFVVLTVDVADSPIADLRLSEIYDVETSTINDDYLLVLQNYVALQLKATSGLCDRFKLHLLDSRFIPLFCRANGDIVSFRKPAMERLIRHTLQCRLDTCSPVSVSIFIQFKTPGLKIPRRLHKSPRIPPKIGGIASTRNFGGSHSMLDAERACATFISDLNVEPVTPHVAIAQHNNKHIVTGIVKDSTEHSESSPPIRLLDSNNDGPPTVTTAICGTCNLVSGNLIVRSIKSNQPECLPHYKHGTRFDGDVFYLNIEPGDVSGVTTELVKVNVIQLCRSALMMYRPIDRGRQLPAETSTPLRMDPLQYIVVWFPSLPFEGHQYQQRCVRHLSQWPTEDQAITL